MSWRDERGMTVIELLVAMTLSGIIFAVTLQVYDGANRTAQRTQRTADATERGREAMGRIVRAARDANGWNATTGAADSVLLRQEPFDLAIGRVAPGGTSTAANLRAVETLRFCVGDRRLYEQRGPARTAPAVACPDPDWATLSVLQHVANAPASPVFTYEPSATGVTTIAIRLSMQDEMRNPPPPQVLRGGVQLRNQNQPPIVTFTATATAGRRLQLNASASVDPEGQLLQYAWADNGTPLPDHGPPVLEYVAPAAGTRTISLTVTDPAGGKATLDQEVEVLP